MNASGRLEFRTFAPFTGGAQSIVSSRRVDDGAAHQVVASRSGPLVLVYLDGRLTAYATYPRSAAPKAAVPIEIGRRSDGTGYFAGRLAEFAYFGRALSAGDVATLYAAGHRPAQ